MLRTNGFSRGVTGGTRPCRECRKKARKSDNLSTKKTPYAWMNSRPMCDYAISKSLLPPMKPFQPPWPRIWVLDLFLSATFKDLGLSPVVLELGPQSNPPNSQWLAFCGSDSFNIEKVMASGVWNSRARMLLPSSETTPSAWKTWRATVDTAIYEGWGGWNIPTKADATRVRFNIAPRQTCRRNNRVDLRESPRCSGTAESWWGRWYPRTHSTKPTNMRNGVTWGATEKSPPSEQPYMGRGHISDLASESLGCEILPECNHMCRTIGALNRGYRHLRTRHGRGRISNLNFFHYLVKASHLPDSVAVYSQTWSISRNARFGATTENRIRPRAPHVPQPYTQQ